MIVSPVRIRETDPIFPFRVLTDTWDISLENHWHKEIELIYLLKGGMQMYINGVCYPLNEGDVVLIAGGDVHGALRPPGNIRIVLQFDDCIFEDSFLSESYIDSIRGILNSAERTSTFWSTEVTAEIKELIFKLKNEYERLDKEPLSKFTVKCLLYNLILICIQKIPPSDVQVLMSKSIRNKNILDNLKDVLQYVGAHYNEDITLKNAAEVLNFAPNYFVRFWKRYTGITFHKYLNQFRLNIAIEMLRDNNKSISEIACKSGFANVKTFNRLFKKEFNLSPTQYKKVYF